MWAVLAYGAEGDGDRSGSDDHSEMFDVGSLGCGVCVELVVLEAVKTDSLSCSACPLARWRAAAFQ